MCKINYAAIVRKITPLTILFLMRRIPEESFVCGILRGNDRQFKLDIRINKAYIILHSVKQRVQCEKVKSQNKATQRTGYAQSPSRTGGSADFSKPFLLRSLRRDASQIRNVAFGFSQRTLQIRSCQIIWCFSPNVLRSRICFCKKRVSRLITPAARPQRSSQIDFSDCRFYRSISQLRSEASLKRSCSVDTRALQSFGPSAKYRTRDCTQKKTPLETHSILLPKDAINRYESLRHQVLDGISRPQGLSVFLYHGVLKGLSILTTSVSSPESPIEKPCVSQTPTPANPDFIHLLANMVLNSQKELIYAY